MKKLLTVVAVICSCISVNAQNIAWANTINVRYTDYISDIHVDKDGNLIICGQFSSRVDFDPGPDSTFMASAGGNGADIFLSKYDSSGNYLWSHRFGSGFFYDEGDRIATDTAGNVFLTGFFGSSVDFDPDSTAVFSLSAGGSRARFLAKYDPDGNFIIAKKVGNAVGSLPSSQDAQTGLAGDGAGNVYMSGFYGTTLVLGPGANGTLSVSGLSDNYFAKYDSALNLIWAHRLSSSGTEYSQGMYVSDSGTVIVLGSFSNTIDFDPDTSNFFLTRQGNTIDGYFAEYDSAGRFIFAKQLVPGSSCAPIAVTIDSKRNIIVTGSSSGTLDANPDTAVVDSIGYGYNDQVFLASYDSAGNYRWAFAYGDQNAYQRGSSLSLDSADNIYLTGFYQPMVDLDPDSDLATLGNIYSGFVALYDTGGNFRTAFNGFDSQLKLEIHNRAIYMAGSYYGLVDFDPSPGVHTMMSDTANASWYLLKMYLCDSLAATPGTIDVPPFCAGDTITVRAGGGGPQYEWTFTAGLTPLGSITADSVVVAVDSAAADEIITSRSIGGCINSAVVYDSIHINHPSTPVITESDDTLYTVSNAIAYQWYLNDTLINGANDSLYSPLVPGIYSVLITDSNGCSATSVPYQYIFTGTENISGAPVNIYPNPFTGTFVVEFPSTVHESIILLRDVNGKILIEKSFSGNKIVIEAERLSAGIYFLEWSVENRTHHVRLVKFQRKHY